jgi:hypothetical protein
MTARTLTRTLAATVGLATAAAVLVSAPSSQGMARADNKVTIQAENTDLSGTVLSKRRACKDERKVILVKQKGAKGGDDDQVISSDTSELENGVGVWSTGNTGLEGRFYAKVKKTALCKAAVSDTVRAVRSND